MTKGPYSQFITIRHYQLIIHELYQKSKTVLPKVFNEVVLGADIPTIQKYSENILETKPDDTITPPDILNIHSLVVSVKSGSFEKFKWLFDNYQFISLIYAKEDNKDATIFNSCESLEYFISSVIRTLEQAINTKSNSNDGIKRILDWLLFSQNTRDDKTLQEWVINLGYYNTRAEMDYKEIYLSCCACQNLDLAQQILNSGLIPQGDIQTGQDIIQPSFRAGMISGNREFLDFIISFDSQNGEWLKQGRENKFSELELIIRCWEDKPSGLGTHSRAELLAWYLEKYFRKYSRSPLSNEELGLVYDFTNEIAGFMTPELWKVLTTHFSAVTKTEKYKLLANRRLIRALGHSNLEMSKLLLAELLTATGETDSCGWTVHIPSETLVDICAGPYPEETLAVLGWLWEQRRNFLTDWHSIIDSVTNWIRYSPLVDDKSQLPVILWIWNNVCADSMDSLYARSQLVENLTNYVYWFPHQEDLVKIMELCINGGPVITAKIWQNAVKWHRTDICTYLVEKYGALPEFVIPNDTYFRVLFHFPYFNCWALETFPDSLGCMDADMAYELVSRQYGQYYKPHSTELVRLLALFPFSGDVSKHCNYLFHYMVRMVSEKKAAKDNEAMRECLKVLYKICKMEPEKYSVILDAEHPNDLTLAQFELLEQYLIKAVECVEQCPICQAVDATLITSCGHQFCADCITKWLGQQQNQKNCPYCRANNPRLYGMKQTKQTKQIMQNPATVN